MTYCILSFSLHIKNVCDQSFILLGFISRTIKHFKNSNCLKILFKSLIRSKLEYCIIIWSPYVLHQIDHIERIQNKFLKMLSYKFSSSHDTFTSFMITILLLEQWFLTGELREFFASAPRNYERYFLIVSQK